MSEQLWGEINRLEKRIAALESRPNIAPSAECDPFRKALERARELCANHALSLGLEWEEPSECWHAWARGAGKGEFWQAKNCHSPEVALERLSEKIRRPNAS